MISPMQAQTKPGEPAKQTPPAASTSTITPTAGRKAGSKVPKDETPEAQFKRLCIPRIDGALNRLRQLKNLARLKPSDAHRAKVIAALVQAVADIDVAWKGSAKAESGGFTL